MKHQNPALLFVIYVIRIYVVKLMLMCLLSIPPFKYNARRSMFVCLSVRKKSFAKEKLIYSELFLTYSELLFSAMKHAPSYSSFDS